ncbi:hypothetical protein BJ508DRAFT_372811 [Ascobolus immersus RN42]|uniref:BTB domain-containing protein n=1 Tax=Ascobolus immersus RN42 TaxID=1160509 RepID=A0A3N4IK90_ASCIM|nr:hypothetical protein BJ508DRAFT_372811 [Ascobolus immersus RN42]
MGCSPHSPNHDQDSSSSINASTTIDDKMTEEAFASPASSPANSEAGIETEIEIMDQCQSQEALMQTVAASSTTNKSTMIATNIDFASSFSSGIVKLLIDAPAWPFHLHITPLQQHSSFFLDSLYPAGTRTIQTLALPEIKLEPFKLFVEYVYTHNYTIPSGRDFHACWLHAQVYFLGGKLGATGLREMACGKLKKALGGNGDMVPMGAVVGLVRGVYEQDQRERKRVKFSQDVVFSEAVWEKENDDPEDEDEEMGPPTATYIPGLSLNSKRPKHEISNGTVNAAVNSDSTSSDDLKLWIVRYIAHKIEKFRVSPEFRALVDEHRDFAFDLLCAVSSGPPLEG